MLHYFFSAIADISPIQTMLFSNHFQFAQINSNFIWFIYPSQRHMFFYIFNLQHFDEWLIVCIKHGLIHKSRVAQIQFQVEIKTFFSEFYS